MTYMKYKFQMRYTERINVWKKVYFESIIAHISIYVYVYISVFNVTSPPRKNHQKTLLKKIDMETCVRSKCKACLGTLMPNSITRKNSKIIYNIKYYETLKFSVERLRLEWFSNPRKLKTRFHLINIRIRIDTIQMIGPRNHVYNYT